MKLFIGRFLYKIRESQGFIRKLETRLQHKQYLTNYKVEGKLGRKIELINSKCKRN